MCQGTTLLVDCSDTRLTPLIATGLPALASGWPFAE
jgi:hypothetical protein